MCIILQDISQEERTALSAVSYVGCGISIICLLITLIVLVYYRLFIIIPVYFHNANLAEIHGLKEPTISYI